MTKRSSQTGFTIVELMVATTVFSIVLVLVTTVIISIGNVYYKGVNQVRVQGAVRGAIDDISRHLQLTSIDAVGNAVNGSTNPQTRAYCIGDTRYTYVLDVQLDSNGKQRTDANNNPIAGGTTFRHVLWRDTIASGGCATANLTLATPSSNGTELMAPISRLTTFTINPQVTPYTVNIAAAAGDSDLLNLTDPTDPTCKGGRDQRFCATAKLSTIVVRRLTP